MIIDVHTHLTTLEQWGPVVREAIGRTHAGDTHMDATPETHRAAMASVDRAIVFGLNSQAMQMHTPNDQIAAYARAYPEKIIGFMSIDPNQPDALEELDRCVNELGLKGIKMSPVYQNYHPCDAKAQRVHRRAEQLGLPILVHAAFFGSPGARMEWANPLHYDGVAREFPDLKIILAHMGLPWHTDTMVVVRKHPNVYADVSSVPLRPWWAYQAVVTFYESDLLNKLLFASDWPIITAEQTINALRNINDVVANTGMPKIPSEAIEGIIHRDSLSLLGLA